MRKLQDNEKLQDMGDLFSQLSLLKNLDSQETAFPRDEIFEKAEEYLRDRNIENRFVFEEYNMDIKLIINYCELIVDNSGQEKTEYRKNLDMEKLRIWFEKLTCNFGVLFYYPKMNRMYFYDVSNTMNLSDLSRAGKSEQIRISEKYLLA